MAKFRTRQGQIIDDLKQYVTDWIKDKSDIKVYVGCDSQVHGKSICYAVSVCMYEKGKGAHIISKRTTETKTNNVSRKWEPGTNSVRLWEEVNKSITVADEINGIGVPIVIHVDYNSNPDELSNELYDSGIGYAMSKGYEAAGKPEAWAASKAADKAVR